MSSTTPPPGSGGDGWGPSNPQQPPYGGGPQYGSGAPAGPGGPGAPAGPSGPGGFGPPDYLQGGPGGPPPYHEPQPRAKHRGLKALVLGSVLALVVAGGSFAFYQADPLGLFRSGPQAAEAMPASALFYVGVDLDPSAAQKINAVRFLNHFPSFRDVADLADERADVRERIFSEAISSLDCGVTYKDDVEPWLGNKFGVAGMPSADGGSDPEPLLAMEITSQSKAEDALRGLQECAADAETGSGSGSGPGFSFAFSGDWVLVAESQKLADEFKREAEDQSLADTDAFSNDMESLGELGVATLWVDIHAAIDAFGEDAADTRGAGLLKDTYRRAAATFRFQSNSAEVAAAVFGDTQPVAHGDNPIGNLPDSTAFAASLSGGANRVDASWDSIIEAAKAEGVDVEAEIADFEAQTGLSLPGDLKTVLGDNIVFAIDSAGVSDAVGADDPTLLNAGVRFTSNPDDLDAIYDKILKLVKDETDSEMPFTKRDFEDGLVLATNDAYGQKLADADGNLGDSDAFRSVIDHAADQDLVVFFNWDAVENDVLDEIGRDGADQEVIDNLRPLQAVGLTQTVEGDYTVATIRVSVND